MCSAISSKSRPITARGCWPPPLTETFIHRQTLAGAYRFTTTELNELASRILDAGARALCLELEIFERLVSRSVAARRPFTASPRRLPSIDVAQGSASLAVESDYVRPRIDGYAAFEIEAGRHPVVEAAMRARGEAAGFIANACDLSGDACGGRILLVTGPNMAGKSTYLRQNALIAILAQAGSFVPARSAHIGIIDRIFARVGASDDLARGRSTFMVEMIETATILNQASPARWSFLTRSGAARPLMTDLPSPGRRSSICMRKTARASLFATHYHELTVLSERLSRLTP